jgi:uncharacterized protein (DUF362 family)
MARITRRQFLRLSGTLAGAALLGAGCAPEAPSPTSTPAPAATSAPSAVAPTGAPSRRAPTAAPAATVKAKSAPSVTPAATAAPTAISAGAPSRADLMRIFPAVPSRVVRTHHSGVWTSNALSPDALGQMLDASLSKLTGLNDATSAWKALFDPGERIAIKVNTIAGSSAWTHVALVNAVTARLVASGVPAENIFVYDRTSGELRGAGFKLNPNGPGVRCVATDGQYAAAGPVAGHAVRLSNVLMSCDALINMPLVKQHGIAGFSFAMKNHYGTFDQPSNFHTGQELRHGLAELNALKPIKDKTRLIIGDALTLVLGNNWDNPIPSDSLYMSFDPVAHDTLGLKLLSDTMTAHGRNPAANLHLAGYWLASGAELGLGTNDPAHIDFVETKIA